MTSCTACGEKIKRGERYVADTRQLERVGRQGAVKVEAAELVAAYHEVCAPARGRSNS